LVAFMARVARLPMPERLISWNYVEPVEPPLGMVRLRVPRDRLAALPPADLAEMMAELDEEARALVINTINDEAVAEVLPELEAQDQAELIESMPAERASDILELMPPDEAADVLGDLPQERAQVLLEGMDPEEAEDVRELMQYEDATAGGRMTTELVAIPAHFTVEQALGSLRELSPDAETVYYLYVTDEQERLVGVISLRDLITAQPAAVIGDLMSKDVIRVHVDEDQEQVALTLSKYHFLAVPVVDREDRLVGIVTVDDVLEVMEEEAAEDLSRVAGSTGDLELGTSVWQLVGWRLPWLLVCLVGAVAAAGVIWRFAPTVRAYPFLLGFVPLLIMLGTQVGTQSSALVLRAIALGEHHPRLFWTHLVRELAVALLWGIIGGAVAALFTWLWGQPALSSALLVATPLSLLIAASLGSTLPLALWKLRIDPALALRPLISILTAVCGLAIYLAVVRYLTAS